MQPQYHTQCPSKQNRNSCHNASHTAPLAAAAAAENRDRDRHVDLLDSCNVDLKWY